MTLIYYFEKQIQKICFQMLSAEIKKIELKGNRTILKDIHFELEANFVYTILGKNGSGKTTLIKALTSLLPSNLYSIEGTVKFNGTDLLSIDRRSLQFIRKNEIKYVFQDSVNSFDPLKTFKYYFELFCNDQKKIDDLLSYFLLPPQKDLYNLHPYEVSGGMAQRIGFILALAAEPQLIIMDEPTSGIDSATVNLVLEKTREFRLRNNTSVLLVTHDLEFAKKISNFIAFIADGNLSPFYRVSEFLNIKDNLGIENYIYSYKRINL